MTKLTGAVVADHIANPPTTMKDYTVSMLCIEDVTKRAAEAELMTRGYNTADDNFAQMEANKSESLKRSLADLNLSDGARSQHYDDGMRDWRKGAIKHFDNLALEHFRKALQLFDAVRISEEVTGGPVNLAGRYAVGINNDTYNEAWRRCDGVQAMELRNIAVVAMKTKSKDLCAAAIRRLGQMDKDERKAVGITHNELADAGFGQQFEEMKRGLAAIRETATTVIERYRSRIKGGNGQKTATQKIRAGLAAAQ